MADTLESLIAELVAPFAVIVNTSLREFTKTVVSSGTPDGIFHYTDDKGLYGILSSGKLWLNDVFNLNDPTELAHGVNLTVSWLERHEDISPSVQDYLLRCISGYVQHGIAKLANSVFIASFSAHSDDLGQWRAYADNGSGFAIEFDGKTLEDGFVGQSSSAVQLIANKVHYDNDLYTERMSTVIKAAISALEQLEIRGCELHLKQSVATEITTELMMCLVSMSSVFKDAQYANENEYRFAQAIQNTPDELASVKTRMRPYNLIRYVEFDWKTLYSGALKRILVGPATESKAERFANDCAREFGFSHIEVIKSKVPYRP
ncbi:MAG: DUF2971 domain-containing protein [Janthinobacterium lividum]